VGRERHRPRCDLGDARYAEVTSLLTPSSRGATPVGIIVRQKSFLVPGPIPANMMPTGGVRQIRHFLSHEDAACTEAPMTGRIMGF